MPEENIDIVRRVYESWARGDFSQGEVFHPEIVFEMVIGRTSQGRRESRRCGGRGGISTRMSESS